MEISSKRVSQKAPELPLDLTLIMDTTGTSGLGLGTLPGHNRFVCVGGGHTQYDDLVSFPLPLCNAQRGRGSGKMVNVGLCSWNETGYIILSVM